MPRAANRASDIAMIPAIFGLSSLALTQNERAFFRDCNPAGYIIFGRNVENRDQLLALTDSLRDMAGRDDLIISIDQEGGRVARMKPPVWPKYPAGEAFDRLYDLAPSSAIAAARANAAALAFDLAQVGITMDHHPSLDVRQAGAHDVIGDRALGHEPKRVAALGRAIVEGLADGGVLATLKHMPGHGRTHCDTHKAMPTVTESDDELALDLAPFAALATHPDVLVGMTGHLLFTAWDDARPATQSPIVIEKIIRQRIGFDGLLLTDDVDMEALDGTVPDRAEVSVKAGCDIALNCWAKMDDMIGIAKRLPVMRDDTAARLAQVHQRISDWRGRAAALDQAALAATRDALLGQLA